jgi:hypothetical protein
MTPTQASDSENENEVYDYMYQNVYLYKSKSKFKVGDYVRVSRIKETFEKYFASWTREVFQISEIRNTVPITYKLIEEDGSPIHGSFYLQELQKTDKPDFYEVESVLKRRTVKGKKQYFVKWLGYSDKYNSWVDSINAKLPNKIT